MRRREERAIETVEQRQLHDEGAGLVCTVIGSHRTWANWATTFAVGAFFTALGCATTATVPTAPEEGTVRVLNTSDRCLRGHDLRVRVDGVVRGRVSEGKVLDLRVPVGAHQLTAEPVPQGAEPTATHNVRVTGGNMEPPVVAWGCGAAETVGHREVRFVVLPHRCRAGRAGPVSWVLNGHPLGKQHVGTRRTFRLPPGEHRVLARWERVVLGQRALSVVQGGDPRAAEPTTVAVGCDGKKHRSGLLPLTVRYMPHRTCVGPLDVRVAGQRVRLKPGSSYTVYVPAGRHLVELSGGTSQAVSLRTAGSVVDHARCIESSGGDSPKTPPASLSNSPPSPDGEPAKPGKKP